MYVVERGCLFNHNPLIQHNQPLIEHKQKQSLKKTDRGKESELNCS